MRPAWRVITESTAGVPGRPRSDDAFGSGLASGDFDRDGWADLAIGTPGKERVSVLYGRASGRGRRTDAADRGVAPAPPGRRRALRLPAARARPQPRRLRRPDRRRAGRGRGAGGHGRGPRALRRPRRTARRPGAGSSGRRRRRPPASARGCGSATSTATVASTWWRAAPTQLAAAGHASYCPGTLARADALPRTGHDRAGPRASPSPTSTATATPTSSRAIPRTRRRRPASRSPGSCGCGSGAGAGRAASPITITQDTSAVPGTDEPGDEFGAVVEAGDVDSDGFADMVVAATRENDGAGSITVIRGGRRRLRHPRQQLVRPGRAAGRPAQAEPGGEFGSTLTILSLTRDRRLDVAVAAHGRAHRRRARDGPGRRAGRLRARRDRAPRRSRASPRSCTRRGAAGSAWRAWPAAERRRDAVHTLGPYRAPGGRIGD